MRCAISTRDERPRRLPGPFPGRAYSQLLSVRRQERYHMIVNLYHWSRFELRHVVALQTVVEARSFWAAADRLDTSQSALSQQIAALEHVVGARLIERSRGRRSIALTEAGEIFLRHA